MSHSSFDRTLRTAGRAATLLAAAAIPAAAQGPQQDLRGLRPTAGLTAASFSWKDGRREQALGAALQLAPAPWLVLGATPTALRVESLGGGRARTGLSDLPVFAGLTHGFSVAGRPSLGVAAAATLPTGDVRRGLGRGRALASAEGALGVSPVAGLTVRAGASRLVHDGGLLPPDAPRTALFGDAVVALGARTNASVGVVGEVARSASAAWVPARAVNAAVVRTLFGSTALLLSGGRTLRGAGPGWSFAVGVGTALGGLSPIGAGSIRSRDPVGATPGAAPGTAPAGVPVGRGGAPLCGLLGC